jgi:hypothetical protein
MFTGDAGEGTEVINNRTLIEEETWPAKTG